MAEVKPPIQICIYQQKKILKIDPASTKAQRIAKNRIAFFPGKTFKSSEYEPAIQEINRNMICFLKAGPSGAGLRKMVYKVELELASKSRWKGRQHKKPISASPFARINKNGIPIRPNKKPMPCDRRCKILLSVWSSSALHLEYLMQSV